MSPTAVQSPPYPRCLHCGAPMAHEQDWCLECGVAATTRVVSRPSWRLPALIVVGALALVAATAAITAAIVSNDSDSTGGNGPATAASTPAQTTTSTASRTAPTTAAKPARTKRAVAKSPARPLPLWPKSKQAYTVVASITTARGPAERTARKLRRSGRHAGLLRTDGYDFFEPGNWVAWVGQFDSKAQAQAAAQAIAKQAPSAYATFIRRTGA